VVVAPTRAGRALHERRAERARIALAELFSGFDADEQRRLADLLDRLVAGLDDLAGLPRASVSD
jgi:DNA-binding MarR family transcriptional regulator